VDEISIYQKEIGDRFKAFFQIKNIKNPDKTLGITKRNSNPENYMFYL
jgi:hypothetical protein